MQKQSLADVLQNRCQAWNFIKKRLQHRCFQVKSLRIPFLQNTSTLMAASGSKQCKPMKTYTESLSCWKKKWYTWTVLLRLVFLDHEYCKHYWQHPILVTLHEKSRSSRPEVFCFWKFRKRKVFSCEFCEIFKNTLFHRTPSVAASENLKAEAVVRGCSVIKVFLEISQNSQQNTCSRVSFLQP